MRAGGFWAITSFVRAALLCLAAGSLHGQVLISLGTGSGCNALQGAQTCTLTARVTGAANFNVTWNFSPTVPGAIIGVGSAPDATGLSTNSYKAPNFVTTRQTVTATVTSVADPTQSASAQISLVPPPVTVAVSPSAVTLSSGQTQQFTALVSGISQSGVTWSISVAVGSIDPSSGLYTAPSFITAAQKITVTAASTFDPAATGTASITLQPSPTISVTVSPTTASLTAAQSQRFTANVVNSTQGVVWAISPQVGSIDGSGLYTAPASLTGSQKVTVTATSVEDPTKSASASITLTGGAPATVTVTPSTVALSENQQQIFTATIDTGPEPVVWSISPLTGTIDSNRGVYTAPATITGTPKVTVTATLLSDPSRTGTATITLTTVVDVGVGAPSSLVQQFLTAFYRNGFNLLVSLPPLANVKRLGTTGYVQEFSDVNKTSGVKLALATISPTAAGSADGSVISVVQLLSPLYVYYSSVGAATAGYPLSDSQNCPAFDPVNTCFYDLFDKGYALFAYVSPLATGQNFAIRGAFFTEWANLGGMNGPGRPVDIETAITAATATTATVQAYASGAVYSISSGINKGKTFGVSEPLYDLYVSQGGPGGTLGLPTSEVVQVATGVYRQSFEGGALQFTASGGPTVQLPVIAVGLSGAPGSSVTLSLGQTLTLTALPVATGGISLTDRPISWSTTNGKVISIQAGGQSAVLKAIGGGTANVTASSGGITSSKLAITVTSVCCQVGDGAPATVQQAFQDAITRDKLAVLLPAPSPAARAGNGYMQMLPASDSNAVYLLTQADQAGKAYVVSGAILAQYQALGGPAGGLGYPISDAGAGGTQLFAGNAALSGNPVRAVSGGILTRWAQLGYESGVAGPPSADAVEFSTFGANSGFQQNFSNGTILAATVGPKAGSGYFVSGLILDRYNALGGAAGDYGMPLSDESVSGSLHQQSFEGGRISYSAGDTAAVAVPAPKLPGVVVAPTTIAAGGRARLAILGFANGATVRVSITGSPDFLVTSTNGAYSWDLPVSLTAKSGVITVRAVDTQSSAAASGTLTIKGFVDNRLPIVKLQGDNQTGLPGAVLPLPLEIALKDASGSPVAGASVVFQASPGAQLSATSTVTDSAGIAQTLLRFPASEGVTAVTADVPSIAQSPVSFYARSAASGLLNFPPLPQAGSVPIGKGVATIAQKGALLTSVAAIFRYLQTRGDLASPNGIADPASLNQFLQSFCVVDPQGNPLCDGFLANSDAGEQVVNLWRAAEFTGGLDVAVLTPTLSAIADRLAAGSPILLCLDLSKNGARAGGHYVIATGVSADGSLTIQDPNPLFGRSRLNDYLNGFTVSGVAWKGVLTGAVEFVKRNPGATRFLLGAISQSPELMSKLQLDVQSPSGPCGTPVDLPDTVDSAGNPAPGGLISRLRACDGSAPQYQVNIGAADPYAMAYRAFATDLAPNGSSVDLSGSSPTTYQATRPQLALVLASQQISLRTDGVVNAASLTTQIAPGSAISIFGTGLSGPGAATTIDLDGLSVPLTGASPFQLNAVVPLELTPGAHRLIIRSAYGDLAQDVNVLPVAPAIFLVGNPPVGAVVNAGGLLNGPTTPAVRGQVVTIYATGMGAVQKQGSLSVVSYPVTAVLSGRELPVNFAGFAPGTIGQYQVNVMIPQETPPGLQLQFALKQGGQTSNPVTLALQ